MIAWLYTKACVQSRSVHPLSLFSKENYYLSYDLQNASDSVSLIYSGNDSSLCVISPGCAPPMHTHTPKF